MTQSSGMGVAEWVVLVFTFAILVACGYTWWLAISVMRGKRNRRR